MDNFSFILFGGTGDLAIRKIIPALHELIGKKSISGKTPIIGVGRRDFTDESYKQFLVKKSGMKLEKLNIKYFRADLTSKGGVKNLENKIEGAEDGKRCNRIYYLATSFTFFQNIVSELKSCCLARPRKCFSRIILEKPFGFNLKSSKELDKNLHKVFSEEDIYRVDHYLAKETVRNINVMKFKNKNFYSKLNNKFVESIEVIADENRGVEGRVEYYNIAGAIRDMIQNHLLQMLSLVLMRRPKKINSDGIHSEKVKILKKIIPLGVKEHLIGQYKSYEEELKKKGIKKNRTETFARVVLKCNTPDWKGVSLILRTGKKMKERLGRIIINKKNGEKEVINITGPSRRDEYSTLLFGAVKGDKLLFPRDDEIYESWRIVDKLEEMKKKMKFVRYEDYSSPE